MSLINVGVAGCLGRMGSYLVKEIIYDKRLNFSGGFEDPKHKNINKKISELIGVNTEHKVLNDSEKIFSQSDVVIDFTAPHSTSQNVIIASKCKTPIVIGTTGLDHNIIKNIKKHSENIAILQSANMSLGVNLLFDLVKKSASVLEDSDYDIEISETHHKHKIDAPSGTAIVLGKLAAKARNADFEKVKAYNRNNLSMKRKIGDIGFSVIRGGEIAGEHTVSFIGTNDRIDLVHTAQSRLIFVKGAIEAAIFLSRQKKGFFSMEDVIKS